MCRTHTRRSTIYIRDVDLSPVVPNEHARLVFQHATRLHNVLEPSQPALDWLEILSLAGMTRPAFTHTIETEPAQAGPLTSAHVNEI